MAALDDVLRNAGEIESGFARNGISRRSVVLPLSVGLHCPCVRTMPYRTMRIGKVHSDPGFRNPHEIHEVTPRFSRSYAACPRGHACRVEAQGANHEP